MFKKLEAKIEALEAKNEALNEELKSKDKELLEKQFIESAEIKKINEQFEPFKKNECISKNIK